MNKAQEITPAWALLDAAAPALAPEAQTWVCVKIGAGEHVEAIDELLSVLADRGVELPVKLVVSLWDRMCGYVGSNSEPRLRTLLGGR